MPINHTLANTLFLCRNYGYFVKLLINNFGNGPGSMSIGLAVTNESPYSL